jgi:adenylate cyclase class 2
MAGGLAMLEVEMKFPVREFVDIARQVQQRGVLQRTIEEIDHYFNAPNRDFAKTDEALRLRQVGTANYVTYKGPKRDAQTKTRAEIEVPLAEGPSTANDFMQLLTHLGFRPVATVHKRRTIYGLADQPFPLEVCLDEVEDVGRFVELEILAPEDQLDAARDQLLATASKLGLATSERRSYLELLLARRGEDQQ